MSIEIVENNKCINKSSILTSKVKQIEIGESTFQILFKNISDVDKNKIKKFNHIIYGIPVIISEDVELIFNRMRINYSDGTSKIMKIFDQNWFIDYNKIINKGA